MSFVTIPRFPINEKALVATALSSFVTYLSTKGFVKNSKSPDDITNTAACIIILSVNKLTNNVRIDAIDNQNRRKPSCKYFTY